ncbi:ABC transporter substrate-binding protein [Rhodoferax ferrireducens]|uniref:ABC transporter substrate-binding protein n=1 Tax=Rhodoferax ferrireducens TaxID=192843 RepID=UPI003BB63790
MLARLRLLLLTFWLGCLAAPAVQAVTVVIVSSERSPAYAQAAEALVRELERTGWSRHDMLQLTVAELAGAGVLTPKLFVALGAQAANALAPLKAPVLCALLLRSSFERVLRSSGRKASSQFSALYLDQPLSRQLGLIQLALPEARRIGVLWGPESKTQAPTLRALAQARGLSLREADVGQGEFLFPGLKAALEGADVLLALADPQVFNSSSIQNILLTSFRAGVPLVAFSPAYVRAGALLALHVTPEQIGQQAALIAGGVLQGKALSATPLYSQDFSVDVNEHVARSLGLRLDAVALRTLLRQREAAP